MSHCLQIRSQGHSQFGCHSPQSSITWNPPYLGYCIDTWYLIPTACNPGYCIDTWYLILTACNPVYTGYCIDTWYLSISPHNSFFIVIWDMYLITKVGEIHSPQKTGQFLKLYKNIVVFIIIVIIHTIWKLILLFSCKILIGSFCLVALLELQNMRRLLVVRHGSVSLTSRLCHWMCPERLRHTTNPQDGW